uniref:Spondin-1 n=1 Tax=Globodera rostochiensis TaxID=31243 RepID=A0A914I7F5_GLORO
MAKCSQRLFEAKGDPSPGSNGFSIEMHDAPPGLEEDSEGLQAIKWNASSVQLEGYVPGRSYVVTVRGWRTQFIVQTFRGFGLTALFEVNEKAGGKFDIKKNRRSRGEARVAPNCRSAGVSHTNLRPKTEVSVLWRAPESGAGGCVLFRATVIQSRHVWYWNENEMTKRFCVIEGYQTAVPRDDPEAECCACDEADYDVQFVGIWSKETHPKDYPTLEHLTHFTDMLGASHSKHYHLWRFGAIASDGLKEIAEWGNTYKGEAEMKANASEVRTLVKMKGLWYPDVQGRTSGHFHVNKYHHLASLAAMFGPSPDWCVGISDVNLCLPDCSWVQERAFDLRPFDAGTDNGYTYMSPNEPAEPRVPIAEISTRDDPRSPFFDENSEEIAPLARLVLRRKRVIAAQCQSEKEYQREAFNSTNTSEDEEYRDRRECAVSQWGSWSLCSATCGKGIRMRSRVFVFPVKAQMFHCHRQTTERQFCNAKQNECGADSDAFNSRCLVSGWDDWTECTVRCGRGKRSRRRHLLNNSTADRCNVELKVEEECIGEDGEDCSVKADPRCQSTSWSDWSPCSASCDDGVKVRTRLFFYAEHEQECAKTKNLMEKERCNVNSCRRLLSAHSEEICEEEKEPGQCQGQFPRYWFNAKQRKCERFVYSGCKGNRNQFESAEECKQFCIPDYRPVITSSADLVSPFAEAIGGGEQNDGEEGGGGGGPSTDCEMSEWSPWSECSVTCGRGKRSRHRSVKSLPQNGGNKCPPRDHRVQERHCEMRPCAPSACRVSRWSIWSPCSVSCGIGFQTRRRRVHRYGLIDPDDQNCHAQELEQRQCRMPCPPPPPNEV